MTAITISKNAQAAIEIAQWIRNGKAPVADLQNRLATACGYVANVRAKCIFRSRGGLVTTGGTSAIPSSLATRKRWRFAWHSGPYASFIYVLFEIAPQDNGTASDPYCTLTVRDTTRTLVGTATMHGGSSDGSFADVPVNMTGGRAHLTGNTGEFKFLSPDTEYTGCFADVGYARLQSATVWEVSLQPTTENGYVQNTTGSGAPIYADDRNDIVTMARLLHKRSGTPVFHWCSDLDSTAPVQAGAANQGVLAQSIGEVTLVAAGGQTGVGELAQSIGNVTLSATGVTLATLSWTGSASPDPVANLGTFNGTVTVDVGGAAQTSLYGTFYLRDSLGNNVTFLGPPTTIDADGFTVTWASVGDGEYAGILERATAAVGTYAVVFQANPYKHSHANVGIDMTSGQSTEAPLAGLTDGYVSFS